MPRGNLANLRPFQKGWKGGPGRPPGMRNRITELALKALGDDFAEHGIATIQRVRETEPGTYLKVVVGLLPRQVHLELSPLSDITDEELTALETHLKAIRAETARQLRQLEHRTIDAVVEEPVTE
jgi:hypothetical protein